MDDHVEQQTRRIDKSMTFTRAVAFYKKYEGLMTDDEILAETGFTAERIRTQIVKTRGQLCWTCANACNDLKCEWVNRCDGVQSDVRIINYPNYVRTKIVTRYGKRGDEDIEYIVSCDRYKWDGRSK